MLSYEEIYAIRSPAYVVTVTTTCVFIYIWINMVGRQDIFTHWKKPFSPFFFFFSIYIPPFKYFSGVKILIRARQNRSFKYIHFF